MWNKEKYISTLYIQENEDINFISKSLGKSLGVPTLQVNLKKENPPQINPQLQKIPVSENNS